MRTRKIGSLEVSVVGLGCNNFGGRIDEAATKAVVDAALDAGITLFDTADIYGGTLSEEFLGRALAGKRDRALIATKFGGPIDDDRKGGASAAYISRACDDSLRRLGTDRGWARFVSVQNEYSLLRRGPEKQGVLDACAKHDIAFIPYFPLASGVLSGKYERGAPPPAGTRLAGLPEERREQALSDAVMNRVEALDGWARAHKHTLLELAFAWLTARPVVASVIAGATKPEQVVANAAAAEWSLTPADLDEIDGVIAAAKGR